MPGIFKATVVDRDRSVGRGVHASLHDEQNRGDRFAGTGCHMGEKTLGEGSAYRCGRIGSFRNLYWLRQIKIKPMVAGIEAIDQRRKKIVRLHVRIPGIPELPACPDIVTVEGRC